MSRSRQVPPEELPGLLNPMHCTTRLRSALLGAARQPALSTVEATETSSSALGSEPCTRSFSTVMGTPPRGAARSYGLSSMWIGNDDGLSSGTSMISLTHQRIQPSHATSSLPSRSRVYVKLRRHRQTHSRCTRSRVSRSRSIETMPGTHSPRWRNGALGRSRSPMPPSAQSPRQAMIPPDLLTVRTSRRQHHRCVPPVRFRTPR